MVNDCELSRRIEQVAAIDLDPLSSAAVFIALIVQVFVPLHPAPHNVIFAAHIWAIIYMWAHDPLVRDKHGSSRRICRTSCHRPGAKRVEQNGLVPFPAGPDALCKFVASETIK